MNCKHSIGYTLVELLIVIAVVGILSSIAFNFFGDNVIAANRSEGRATLTQVAASLEKCKSLYGAYNAPACNVVSPVMSESNYYSIDTTTDRTATTFTLIATPAGRQLGDSACTSMTLTNIGEKDGVPAATNECW